MEVATIEERADKQAAGICQMCLSRTFQVYHIAPKYVFLYTSVILLFCLHHTFF